MDKLKALTEHFAYNPLVLRDGNIHEIALADIIHANDWDTKLILYPRESNLCPTGLEEAVGFIEGYKTAHIDFSGLIDLDYAISVDDLEKDPYVIFN